MPWFRLAAEQGDAKAQNNLGLMYAKGEGVRKDSVIAHMWFNIAGSNGNEKARENRDLLERVMKRSKIRRATKLAHACMDSTIRTASDNKPVRAEVKLMARPL